MAFFRCLFLIYKRKNKNFMATQSVRIGWRPYVNLTSVQAAANLLDSYSGAAAAYSLRKLKSSYTGSAIRVRRSSDNTELNIGFDSDGNLDTVALSVFVGSVNGFVTTWYDQSGSLRDITQSTAANQPKIVNAGSIYRLNGLPSVYFYDNWLSSSLLTMPINNVTNTTVSSSFTTDSLGWGGVNYQSVLSFGGLSDYFGYATYYTYSNSQFEFNSESRFSNWNGQKTSTSLNKVNLSFNYHGYTQILSWLNSNSFGSSTFANTNLSIQQYLTVGSRWHASGFYFHLRGYVSEVIIWNNDKTSNRTQIESNINTYYSVYPNPSSVWNLLTSAYSADAVGSSSLKTSLVSVYNGESNTNDSKGTNNGTAVGGLTYTAGKIGNALSFNGTNAYVSLPTNSLSSLTGDFSISCWVNLTSLTSVQCFLSNYIFTSGINDGYIGFRLYYNTTGGVRFEIGDINSVGTILSTNNYLTTNAWYNIVVTRKGSTRTKIYINGLQSVSNTDSRNPAYVTTYPAIGTAQYLSNNTTWFMSNGSKIDAVGIWTKELTASEVSELYNSGNGAQYIGDNFYKPTTNDALGINNGTAQGGLTYGPGKIGTAFQFNGTNAYVSLPNTSGQFNFTGDFSVSMWFRSSNLSTSRYAIGNYKGGGSYGYGWVLYYTAGGFAFDVRNNNSINQVTKLLPLLTNTWYHVVAVRKMGQIHKLYVNGVDQSATQTDGNVNNIAGYLTNQPMDLGGLSNANAPALCDLDGINIWNKVLTQTEITELYNSGNGKQYPN